MESVAIAANILLIALLVAMFLEAVRERRYSAPWLHWGIAGAAVIVAADLFLYLVTPADQRLIPPAFYAVATAVVVVRTVTVTVVGLAAAERLGIGALPLLRPRQDRGPRSIPGVLGAGFAAGIALTLYSAVLFLIASPGPAGGGVVSPPPPLDGAAFLLLLGALTLTVLGEELTFRLGIQNWLAGLFGWTDARYWIAISLSSALWTAGHIGIMEPEWIKLAQIFPAGLVFGWLFLRFGFEASVIAHALLNLIMPFVTPRLLG